MLVKICGLSNEIDAMIAVKNNADALGFVMGGKVMPVEVEPHAQNVRQIIKKIPKNIDTFVVTHLFDVDDIIALAEYVNSTGIQVSEDIGFEKLKQIRTRTTKKIIKTIVVDEKSIEKLNGYSPYCDFILLDTRHSGYTGGTGVVNDWNMCKKIIEASNKPVYLAGGLTPENLIAAIKQTNPAGVDVSTGVSAYSESYLRKDRKDEIKIKKFIEIAKKF